MNAKTYTLLYLSGGTGSRMHADVPKQYMDLAGMPVIVHSLLRIESIDAITDMVVVCAPEYRCHIQSLLHEYHISKPVRFADCGRTRQESVFNGLQLVESDDMILHESARPFVTADDFRRLINEPHRNATFGIPVPFTVVRGHERYESLLERSELVNIQLPQKYDTRLLKSAHEKAVAEKRIFTEDGSMIFHYFPETHIAICQGMDYDIKLTTPVDMIVAEKIYETLFRES